MTALIVAGFFVLPVFANAQSYPVTQTTQGGYSYTMPYGNWSYPSPYPQEAPYPTTPPSYYYPCSNYWDWGCGYNWYQQPISITNVSGPTALTIGQQGMWSITTNAQSNSYVSVSVRWGDEMQYGYGMQASAPMVQQQNTFTHAYQYAGTYTITFTATDQYGQSNTATASVTVGGGGCTYNCGNPYNFVASPTSGPAPLAVTFSMNPQPGQQSYDYAVDFGDGQRDAMYSGQCANSSGPCLAVWSVPHTYMSSGTFTAKLIDNRRDCVAGGCDVVATASVTVSGSQQQAEIVSATPTYGQAPLGVSFQVSNANLNSTYYIDYGDGANAQMDSQCYYGSQGCSTSVRSSHTYSQAGTYTARISASSQCPSGMYCPMYLRNVGTVTITVSGGGYGGGNCWYDYYSGQYYCSQDDYWWYGGYGSEQSYSGYVEPSYSYPSYPAYPSYPW